MIRVHVGDITRLDVDAIVNAANRSLLGGGGVDGAIHRAAGPELREHCAKLGGCETGDARITPGFRLPARYVIHAVGPVWHGGRHGEDEALARCYERAFALARAHGVRTIAFPCISTGAYRFPRERAARIALRSMRACENAFDEIIVCCFSEDDARLYRSLMGPQAGES